MKKLLLISILLLVVYCQKPIVGPLLSIYPCKGQNEVMITFEPALPPKDNNRYYVNTNNVLPVNSNIRLNFDSEVDLTFITQTGQNTYERWTLSYGRSFSLNSAIQFSGLGFIVKGTQPGVTPYLLNFLVNGVELCNNPIRGFLEQFASEVKTEDKTCGRRTVDHNELITHSAPTKPGDWPWHAAIYRLDRSAIKYICGGTLLSKKAVLTAAHCTTYRGAKYPSEVLTVVLGKYTLTGDDEESVEKGIHKIVVHEHFNYRLLINDIALLILITEVTYNDYIQPACLWNNELEKKMKSNTIYGTVVGWGFDMNDSLSTALQQMTMPIVNEATCLKTNAIFYSYALNDKSFCAGYRNGTSVCNGDSGGAFQVFIPDELPKNVSVLIGSWHVKGIVSMTFSRHDAPICDPEQYALFTDVDKYTEWIQNHWND